MPVGVLALILLADGLGDAKPERVRSYDLQHVRAELSFDLARREVRASARLTIAPLAAAVPIRLDASGLAISSVRAEGRAVDYRVTRDAIEFTPPRASPFDVTIDYTARPRRGLFFLTEGGRVRQVYSQGFPDANRHWLPLYDFPNDKTTSEIVLTVPAAWSTVSNGALVSVKDDGPRKIWHWRLARPQSTYLISFVAGEMDCESDRRLEYCVSRGEARHAQLTFGRTPHAMQFFESKLGPFPWPRYSQIILTDSIYAGMENTGAVTYAPDMLLTPELAPDYQQENDAIIAHELAHQWFGDSVTFTDFRHLWLSEGFATGLGNLWVESYYGPAAAAEDREIARQAIVSSPGTQRYPLVRAEGSTGDPAELLVYQKGGWVIHMLRRRLGDDAFWRVMRDWYSSKAYGSATTADFKRAVGPRGGLIFEQYVERPGHPVFQVAWRWENGRVIVRVEQKAALFRLPVTLDIDGTRTVIEISKAREEFVVARAAAPTSVRFDPDGDWLAAVTISPAPASPPVEPRPSREQTLITARTDPSWVKRAEAVRRAASTDPELWREFIAVDSPRELIRVAAIQAYKLPADVIAEWAAPGKPARVRMAALRSGRAPTAAIQAALQDENHRVRMAAAAALAQRKDRAALRKLAASDPLDLVADRARALLVTLDKAPSSR